MAKRTGFSVETLSELNFVASQSGAEFTALEGAIRKMQKNTSDLNRGLSTQVDAFGALGVTYKQIESLSPEGQFKLLAERIASIDDPTKRAAASMEIFGRAGTGLLPMFENGAKGIDDLQKKARSLGLTMSQEDAASAEKLTDSFDSLWKVVRSGVFNAGGALAEILGDVADKLAAAGVWVAEFIKENKGLIVTAFKVGAAILAAGAAIAAIGVAVSAAGALFGVLSGIVAAFSAVVGLAVSAVAALATPIGLVVAALVAVGVAFVTQTDIVKNSVAFLTKKFNAIKGVVVQTMGGIKDALAAGDIKLAAQILWAGVKVAWAVGTRELQKIWVGFKAAFFDKIIEAQHWVAKVVINVSVGIRAAWAKTIAYLEKALSDSLYIAKQMAFLNTEADDRAYQDESIAINRRLAKSLGALREEKAGRLKMLKDLEKEEKAKNRRTGQDNLQQIKDEEQALKNQLANLTGRARTAVEAKDEKAKNREGLNNIKDGFNWLISKGKSIAENIGKVKTGISIADKSTSAGTFSASSVGALGGKSEQAKQTEQLREVTKNTKETSKLLRDGFRTGGLVFP
jgi:hypothetical protein